MIKLDIKSYCQDCSSFEPAVFRQALLTHDVDQEPFPTETKVYCKNKKRCEALMRHLKKRFEESKDVE